MKLDNVRNISWVWYWILGPWMIGVGLIFASGLIRLLLFTKVVDHELHFQGLGAYIVTSRAISFGLCIVLLLLTLGLLMLLSRRVIAS